MNEDGSNKSLQSDQYLKAIQLVDDLDWEGFLWGYIVTNFGLVSNLRTILFIPNLMNILEIE